MTHHDSVPGVRNGAGFFACRNKKTRQTLPGFFCQPRLVVVVIAVTTMLDDDHVVMMTIPVPMPIMIAMLAAFLDHHRIFRLGRCNNRKGQPDRSSSRKNESKLTHGFLLGRFYSPPTNAAFWWVFLIALILFLNAHS
jgi:hypothetical protein